MSSAHFLLGDTRDVIATIPDGSVDLVVTSPPFLALRSYLPADHPDKGREIGSEATPAEFIDVLLGLTAEWRRVLAPHGSIAIELGDTYSGSGGAGGDYAEGGLRDGQQAFSGSAAKRRANGVGDDYRPARSGRGTAWPLAKSLTLIPELFRIGLVYGLNPLTGTPSPAGRWRARNVVRWVRPNPPVGALGDKFRPATSEIVIACVSDKRWFDGDAVRAPLTERARAEAAAGGVTSGESYRADPAGGGYGERVRMPSPHGGAPLLDWWEIPPGGYKGSHYAVFPPALVVPLVESMCPREVCTACGTPRRRIVERTYESAGSGTTGTRRDLKEPDGRTNGTGMQGNPKMSVVLGESSWSSCDCAAPFRPGIVLDPFVGSGTTLAVATGHGRTGVGIDLDERNLDLARERCGMFLTTDHPWATVEGVS